jgi:hypothetical protein
VRVAPELDANHIGVYAVGRVLGLFPAQPFLLGRNPTGRNAGWAMAEAVKLADSRINTEAAAAMGAASIGLFFWFSSSPL